ncbi:hypothetical protein [Vulcanisaeta souniana]|uniref:hypothetical protein n=1 Tax=Vulcanisaeta souniana TaxID=164452 RepID=UPI000B336B60|nr:hypothetical protein [Vulcanisaeta souniana]
MIKESVELVDEYEVVKGLIGAFIVRDKATGLYLYNVVEPMLSDNASRVLARTRELLRVSSALPEGSNSVEGYLKSLVDETMGRLRIKLSDEELRGGVMYYLMRDTVGYGRIDPLIRMIILRMLILMARISLFTCGTVSMNT